MIRLRTVSTHRPLPSRRARRGRGAALFALLLLVGCRAELARDLGPEAAEEIMVALDGAGIAAAREPSATGGADRFDVHVERDSLVPAMALLRSEGLPRQPEAVAVRSGLLPSVTEERLRRDAAVAEALRVSLEQLAGVHRARVHVARDDEPRALDEAGAAPRASVLLHQRGPAPDQDAARALVAGAVSGLAPASITIVVQPAAEAPTAEPAHVWVGPFAVSRASAGPLRGALAGALGLNLVLAGALVLQRRRART